MTTMVGLDQAHMLLARLRMLRISYEQLLLAAHVLAAPSGTYSDLDLDWAKAMVERQKGERP